MDDSTFDRFARVFSTIHSRRQLLVALVFAVLGGPGLAEPGSAGPGCKDVGATCRKAEECCSGICQRKKRKQGKKGKKGKRRKKTCRSHDATTCTAGQHEPACISGGTIVACTSSSSASGICNTTTGNAAYCMAHSTCFPCAKDIDCQPVCGPRAACIQCAFCVADGGTLCAGTDALGCSAI